MVQSVVVKTEDEARPEATLSRAASAGTSKRNAQTAYRQRQKDKVTGLEAEVAALQDRLKELELERSQHRAQLEALSQHVTSRNNSVDLGFSPDGSGRAGERGPGDLDDEAAADVAAYVTAVRGPLAPGTTAAECRTLSPAFLADVWQEHLRSWFSLLDAGGSIPGTPAARSLTAQVQLFIKVYFYLWEHHLALLHGMVAEYIGRAMRAGMPDAQQDHVYERQLAAMQLSVDQQDKIVAEFQAMVARLNGIFDEKAALLASLGQPHEASPANLMFEVEVSGQVQDIFREYCLAFCLALRPADIARGFQAQAPRPVEPVPLGALITAQRGVAVAAGEDSGMASVLGWLLRDAGASTAEHAMSVTSLQDLLDCADSLEMDPTLDLELKPL